MQAPEVKRKLNWKRVGGLMRRFAAPLLLASICTVTAVLLNYAIPVVVSFTLDYVVLGVPVEMPAFLARFLDARGGRQYLIDRLYLCGLALVVLTALNGLFAFLRRQQTALAAEGIAKSMRDELYRHLSDVPCDYHKHANTGDLVQRCTSDVDTVRRFVSLQLMEIIRTIAMIAAAAAVLFSLHARMALFSMMLMPVLTVSSFLYFRLVTKYFTASDVAEGALSTMLQENLTGMRVVRAFGQQKQEFQRFEALNASFRDKTYQLIKLLGFYWGMSDSAGYLQIAAALCAGVVFVVQGSLTLGNLTLFITYTSLLTWPVRQLGRILAEMGKAAVSFGRLDEILSAPVETEPGRALSPDMHGDVVFDRVCFGYDKYDDVLRNISFTAHPGQTIGILGTTGSGKTSLMQLLSRLYPVTAGSITIGGVNVNDISHEHLRRNIGIVLQEPFLYARTIMENIRIVNPDARDEAVYEAAKTAAVHDVIETFEQGYDTVVGERGVTLSGGQQQRVAIARTLMQRAPILIFDDSTSAVDAETDALIRQSLNALSHDGITVLISHRITTLRRADLILVLESGNIVQRGTHESLLHEDGPYRRVAEIQDAVTEGGEQV